MQTIVVPKPEGYKSSRIVYDGRPILIIDVDYTAFQLQHPLKPEYAEFEISESEDGSCLIVTEIED